MDNSSDWIFPKDFIVNPRGDNADGSGTVKDRDNRSKTVWFMEDMSRELNMDRRVLYSASVYFHRFYLFHSFQTQNRFHIALACLFLAGKAEERAHKLKELVHCYFVLRFRKKPDENEFRDTFKQAIIAERLLLQTLNFEVNIVHPYNIFVNKMREWRSYVPDEFRKNLMQTAVNFLNDSYRSTFCLEYSPVEIAVSVLYLATITLSVRPINPNPRALSEITWTSIFEKDIREYRLRCLCLEIMEMYEHLAILLQEADDVVNRVDRQRISSQLVSEMGGIVPAHITITQNSSSNFNNNGLDDQTTLDAMTPREKTLSFASSLGGELQQQHQHSHHNSLMEEHHGHRGVMNHYQEAIEASFGDESTLLGGRRPTVTVTKMGSSTSMTTGGLSFGHSLHGATVSSGFGELMFRGDLSTVSISTMGSTDEQQSVYAPQRSHSGGNVEDTPIFFQRHPAYQSQLLGSATGASDTPTFSDLASVGGGMGSNNGSGMKGARPRSRSNSLTSEYCDYSKRVRVE